MQILSEEKMKREISGLRHYHSLYRVHIMNLLDEGYSNLKSTADALEKINQLDLNTEQNSKTTADINLYESECRDVHVNTDDGSDLVTEVYSPSTSDVYAIYICVCVFCGVCTHTMLSFTCILHFFM